MPYVIHFENEHKNKQLMDCSTDYTDFGLIKPTDYYSVSEEKEARDSDTRTFPYDSFAV